jgi:hypothetical protein
VKQHQILSEEINLKKKNKIEEIKKIHKIAIEVGEEKIQEIANKKIDDLPAEEDPKEEEANEERID